MAVLGFRLKVPVLVLEAGLDRLVRSDGIERFRRRVPQAMYRLFDGAYHDLFDETDDIRQEGGGCVTAVMMVWRCAFCSCGDYCVGLCDGLCSEGLQLHLMPLLLSSPPAV